MLIAAWEQTPSLPGTACVHHAHKHTLLLSALSEMGCEEALFAVEGERGRHVLRSLPSRGFPRVVLSQQRLLLRGEKFTAIAAFVAPLHRARRKKNPRSKQTCPSKRVGGEQLQMGIEKGCYKVFRAKPPKIPYLYGLFVEMTRKQSETSA